MSRVSRTLNLLTLLFSVACSAWLLIGGVWLLSLGGSAYYLISGLAMAGFSLLLWRRKRSALYLYAAILIASALWAWQEAGSDYWTLVPRLDVWVLLGIWFILPFSYRQFGLADKKPLAAMLIALLANGALLAGSSLHDPQEINGELPLTDRAPAASSVPAEDWTAYGRTQEGVRYSPLKQINEHNVQNLQVAWQYHTGDVKTANDPGEITNEVTPLKAGNMLYLCTPHQILLALDAVSGKEKWRFDPKLKSDPSFQHITCRGVSYHEMPAAQQNSGSQPAHCARRIFLPVDDGRLIALDAASGERCENFASHGELNLQHQQPNAYPGGYEPTSPPIVTDKVVIVAGSVTDNLSTREPSGVIRGFDIDSGKLVWAFDPGAKDPNALPAEGETFSANSPNSWAPAAYDAQRDIIYLPMGVSTPDIWGGHRTPEQERYASGLLALHASTGKLAWFYQTVHHDLWDMDLPSQPTLADITDNSGKRVPVVYVPAKTGNIFVLNRETGQPVVPAPETPVPQGPAKGDHLNPTQPFSQLTFRPKQNLQGKDMWGATMFDQLACRVMFHRLRYEGPFTPPSEQGTLVFPGDFGMFEWGGIAVDTDRQIAIANPMAMPFISRLVPRGPGNPIEPGAAGAAGSGSEAGVQHMYGVPYGVELNPFLSPLGLPCLQPSWGFVSAINLQNHQIVWKKRIGTVRDSAPVPLPFKMGVPMLGGPVTTAGNVFFVAGTLDNYLRAYSVRDGKLLWQARLPAGGQATPMTYAVNGKQYVVIMAGGHGSFGTKMGDTLIAYALP